MQEGRFWKVRVTGRYSMGRIVEELQVTSCTSNSLHQCLLVLPIYDRGTQELTYNYSRGRQDVAILGCHIQKVCVDQNKEKEKDCCVSHLNKGRAVSHVPSLKNLQAGVFCGRKRGNQIQQVSNSIQELNLEQGHGLGEDRDHAQHWFVTVGWHFLLGLLSGIRYTMPLWRVPNVTDALDFIANLQNTFLLYSLWIF